MSLVRFHSKAVFLFNEGTSCGAISFMCVFCMFESGQLYICMYPYLKKFFCIKLKQYNSRMDCICDWTIIYIGEGLGEEVFIGEGLGEEVFIHT